MEQGLFLRRSASSFSTTAAREAWPPVAVAVAGLAWMLRHGLTHDFVSFSDGVYLYAAAHGAHALYTQLALSVPPGAVLAAAGVWKLSPHVEAVRLALALVTALAGVLSYRAGRRLLALEPGAATVAAAAAVAGPVHAQFVGLEGDAFLTPLVLLLALALHARRPAAVAVVVGVGFLFKLTWLPFALAAVVCLGVRRGARAAAGAAAVAAAGYAGAIAAFGWRPHELLEQLVLAESHSGLQPRLVPGIVLALGVMWWPFLVLAPAGLARAGRELRALALAGAAASLFMLKQGTFFNVLDPVEPLLVLLAAAGAVELRRGGRRARLVVAVCAAGALVHAASLVDSATRHALPAPLGAALVDVDNARAVDRLAAVVDAHSAPDEPVLVNPLVALVAGRREAANADDWFILHALGQPWERAKRSDAVVVSVDSNVVSFDPDFGRDTGVSESVRVAQLDAPPIRTTLYAR